MANVTTLCDSFKDEIGKGIHNFGTTLTGTTASGSASITGLPTTHGLAVGQLVTGTGIPAGAKVASITSATAVTIDQNATANGTVSITFADDIWIALFPAIASLTQAVTAYGAGAAVAANEIGGSNDPNRLSVSGYSAGGQAAAGPALTAAGSNAIVAHRADWDWNDVVFNGSGSGVTVASVIFALMYNKTKGNRAIQYVTYDAARSATAAAFTVTIPETPATGGALRFGP